jgi:hypothetical protein
MEIPGLARLQIRARAVIRDISVVPGGDIASRMAFGEFRYTGRQRDDS